MNSYEKTSISRWHVVTETDPWSAMVTGSFVRTNKKSSYIAVGPHVGNDDLDAGAGDQKVRLGSVSNEIDDRVMSWRK